MVMIEPKAPTVLEEKHLDMERLKSWHGLWKVLLGTAIVGILTGVLNWQIQSQELLLKRQSHQNELELKLQDQQIQKELQQMAQDIELIHRLIESALAEEVGTRRRLAEFLSRILRDTESRTRWQEYASQVNEEYVLKKKDYMVAQTELDEMLDKPRPNAQSLTSLTKRVSDLKRQIKPKSVRIAPRGFAPPLCSPQCVKGEYCENGHCVARN